MKKYEHQVKIDIDKYMGILITNTHNGYQWSSIAVEGVKELKQVRDAIDVFLAGKT